jgi:hypothetical protein
MAWMDRIGKLPSRTLNLAAGVAMLAGLFALGVGIGTGCTPLMVAGGAVIFIGGLVPAAVDCRDAKRRHEPTARREAAAAVTRPAAEWDMENNGRESGGLVWIELEAKRQRLH